MSFVKSQNEKKYHNIFIQILYAGLFLFIGGIFFLKDGGNVTRLFYFLVAIPTLVLFPRMVKELRFNRNYLIFTLLPIYLFISFFWAAEENIKKDLFFHFRNLLCVFVYIASIRIILKEKKDFIIRLLKFLFYAGYGSALVSIIYYFSKHGFTTNSVLVGYFTNNSNKVGSIYSLHFCLSLFLLINRQILDNRFLAQLLVVSALVVDGLIVWLSQAVVPWLFIVVFIFIVIVRNWNQVVVVTTSVLSLLVAFGLSYSNGFWGHFFQMTRVQARIDLVHKAIAQMDGAFLFGLGLSYKLPLVNMFGNGTLPHPHNIFVDCFRFGGAIALFLVCLQCYLVVRGGLTLQRDHVEVYFLLFWFVAGVIILSFYGQQPLTRPGGYLWFFYWMPGVILLVKWFTDKEASDS